MRVRQRRMIFRYRAGRGQEGTDASCPGRRVFFRKSSTGQRELFSSAGQASPPQAGFRTSDRIRVSLRQNIKGFRRRRSSAEPSFIFSRKCFSISTRNICCIRTQYRMRCTGNCTDWKSRTGSGASLPRILTACTEQPATSGSMSFTETFMKTPAWNATLPGRWRKSCSRKAFPAARAAV